MRRDIVSLQVGTTANYVGTHFWNLQDEYLAVPQAERELSPSTFFREVNRGSRAARSGLRYAPRLQIIDATGAFGALSTDVGAVLAEREEVVHKDLPTWSRRVERYVRRSVPHSQYVDSLLAEESRGTTADGTCTGLEDGVNYWSDFLKTRLHPRTCFPLRGVHHGVTNLDSFEVGKGLATSSFLEEAYNELRFFIEECDSFGGLCLSTNADNAYAGISANYLSYLQEELGSSVPVLMFSVHNMKRMCSKSAARAFDNEFSLQQENLWSQNEARLAATCLEFSAEYIPLSSQPIHRIPLLHTKKQDLFHCSGVLGLSMDVSLVPLQQNLSLAGLLSALRPAPFASVGGLACNFPNPARRLVYETNLVQTAGSISFSSIWSEPDRTSKGIRIGPSSCTEVVSACGLGYSVPVFSNITSPVTIPIPYPTIFDSSMERNKHVTAEKASRVETAGSVEVEQIALLAGLATVSGDAYSALTSLGEAVKPAGRKTRTQSAAQSAGVEESELCETAEALTSRGMDYLTV